MKKIILTFVLLTVLNFGFSQNVTDSTLTSKIWQTNRGSEIVFQSDNVFELCYCDGNDVKVTYKGYWFIENGIVYANVYGNEHPDSYVTMVCDIVDGLIVLSKSKEKKIFVF